jgi:methylase of polypeptide subunit release factors
MELKDHPWVNALLNCGLAVGAWFVTNLPTFLQIGGFILLVLQIAALIRQLRSKKHD